MEIKIAFSSLLDALRGRTSKQKTVLLNNSLYLKGSGKNLDDRVRLRVSNGFVGLGRIIVCRNVVPDCIGIVRLKTGPTFGGHINTCIL